MSTNTDWRYILNTFEINTRGSNVKMLSLSTDTYSKLKAEEANPAIASIILVYEPVFFSYRDICQQYDFKRGNYHGGTVGFEDYIKQIPTVLRVWESLIRAVYVEDSPQESAIFPRKRVPFESGTYEDRISAIGSLQLKTASDPALAAANAQILSFYNSILAARLSQQQGEGVLGEISDLRENQRVVLAGELMGVLGQVIYIHRHNLVEAARYFDLSLLQTHSSDLLLEQTVELEPNSMVNIPISTFVMLGNYTVTLNNPANSSVVGIAFSPDTTTVPNATDVDTGSTMLKTAEELNFSTINKYLNLKNDTGGHATVTLKIRK